MPIQQITELEQLNLIGSAKFSLLPRGRRISRLAWIPNTFVPYVGAGGGYGNYKFRQNGDFVDFVDGNHIFTRHVHVRRLGADLPRHAAAPTSRYATISCCRSKARYSWQHADLDQDFIDFEPIDLGGFRFGAGIHFVF